MILKKIKFLITCAYAVCTINGGYGAIDAPDIELVKPQDRSDFTQDTSMLKIAPPSDINLNMVIIDSTIIGLNQDGIPVRPMVMYPANVPVSLANSKYPTIADLLITIIQGDESAAKSAMTELCLAYIETAAEGKLDPVVSTLVYILNCRNYKNKRTLIDKQGNNFLISENFKKFPGNLFFVGLVPDETAQRFHSLIDSSSAELDQLSEELKFTLDVTQDFTLDLMGKMSAEFVNAFVGNSADTLVTELISLRRTMPSQIYALDNLLMSLSRFIGTINTNSISFIDGEVSASIIIFNTYLRLQKSRISTAIYDKFVKEFDNSYADEMWTVKDQTLNNLYKSLKSSQEQSIADKQPTQSTTDSEANTDRDFTLENLDNIFNYLRMWSPDELSQAIKYLRTSRILSDEILLPVTFLTLEQKKLIIRATHLLKFSYNKTEPVQLNPYRSVS